MRTSHRCVLAIVVLLLGAVAPAQRAPDVRIDTSNPVNFGGASAVPTISVTGSNVYAAWRDDRAGVGDYDIYFNRSADGGRTWLASDVRIDTAAAGITPSEPVVASTGSHVFVAWIDGFGTPVSTVSFTRSHDFGASWSASERIDVGLDTPSIWLRMVNDQEVVHLVWQEFPSTIHYATSAMAGDPGTWTLPVTISGSANASVPAVACSGSNVYVVWRTSDATGLHLGFNRTTTGGSGGGFFATPAVIGDPSALPSAEPAIACSGDDVYLAWADGRNDPVGLSHDTDVYFQKSADAGLTWFASDVRVDVANAPGFGDAWSPLIAVGPGTPTNVYVAWSDARTGSDPGLYLTISPDGGATWPASEMRLDVSTPPNAAAGSATMTVFGSSICAVWQSDYASTPWPGAYQIYSRCSYDAGTTWDLAEVKLNTGGSWNARYPRMAFETPTKLHVVWEDARPAPGEPFNWDVYTNVWERGLAVATGPASASFSLDITMDPFLSYQGAASLDDSPGIVLTNHRTIPLVYDSLAAVSLDPAFASIFTAFSGSLDAAGHASAAILYPPGAPSGVTYYVAFVTLDPTAPDGVRTVTRAVPVTSP